MRCSVATFRGLTARIGEEVALNGGAAIQIAAISVIPFLPFVFLFDDGNLRLVSRPSFLVAVAGVLIALLSRWVFFVFALAYVPLSLASIHIVRHFGGDGRGWSLNQPDSRVEVILESPLSEIREYFQAHWWPSDWVLSCLAVLYLVALTYLFRTRHGLTATAKAAVVLALVVCIALFMHYRTRNSAVEWPQYQLVYGMYDARPRLQQLAERRAYLARQFRPSGDCTRRYRKIVIVIGESAVTDHMSAFGYQRKTTPFADESAPYAFAALSPANLTRVALPLLMSAAGQEDFGKFYKTPSLVGALRACGYKTLWISNQGRVGRHDSIVTSLASEADQQVFLNELSSLDAKLDGQIIAELDRLRVFQSTAHATFIHLIGSHAKYEQRYPNGFGASSIVDRVDAYDNSILYTDFLLAQLYQRFRSDGLLFVYVSDHGEVVSNELHGHAFTPGYQEEHRAPLLIWTEDRAAMNRLQVAIGTSRLNLESFDDIIHFLVGNTDSPFVSTRSVVTNLAPGNTVSYEELRSMRQAETHGSNSDQ